MPMHSIFFLALQIFAANPDVPQAAPGALDIKIEVQRFKLDNGLTVLLHKDSAIPLVSYHQWFRVGSRNEKPGKTGLAHFFEHLMFKGTKNFPPGSFDKIVQANGGANNAFTSRDYTGYFINLPSDKLELAMNIESDRMRNLLFEQGPITSEREVVKEERRMRVENDVMGTLWEVLFQTVYKVHPYREPVLGSMRDLEGASIDDLRKFYQTYYAPNNAVVVISGDIDYEKTKAMVDKFYGKIQSQPLPELAPVTEPVQTAERSQIIKKDVQASTLAVVYRTPNDIHPDAPAIEFLANILGSGTSSRLHRRMVYNEQIASSSSAWTYGQRESSLFAITTALKPGQKTDRALQDIAAEVQRLRTNLVSEREVTKAKNQLMLGFVNQLKTASGKAYALAAAETQYGDYNLLFEDFKKYQSVTREDIKRVADTYLAPHQRSIIQVVPSKMGEQK